jgi:RNA polymerase sigma factor (sigma-70 family)
MSAFEEVLAGCLKQDNKCKEMIYKSFYGYLIAVILRYVKERADAEELVNDSFIKIFKNVHTFRHPQDPEQLQNAFRAWSGKISARTAIDHLRSRKTFLNVDDIPEEQHNATRETAIADLNVQDIMKLINALPDTHRIVFNMYEIEGYSHDEIAKTLEIPVSSSRVYLTRAKNKLRELYSIPTN